MAARGKNQRPGKLKSYEELIEFLGQHRELQLGLGQRLDHDGFRAFGGSVARGSHFAHQEILGALEHFLFAEGERLAATERYEALEDYSDFEEGSGAHALGVFLEAMFPVVMGVELALLEEAQNLARLRGTNYGTKAHGHGVRLRHHNAQATGNNSNHEVTFRPAIQNAVTDLLDNTNAVVWVNDLVADFIVHGNGCPSEVQE